MRNKEAFVIFTFLKPTFQLIFMKLYVVQITLFSELLNNNNKVQCL